MKKQNLVIIALLLILFIPQGCCIFKAGSWDPLPCSKDKEDIKKKDKSSNFDLEKEKRHSLHAN